MSISQDIWDRVLQRLAVELPEYVIEGWIRPLRVLQKGNLVDLYAQGAFHRDRVERDYLGKLRNCIAAELGREMQVRIAVEEIGSRKAKESTVVPLQEGHSELAKDPDTHTPSRQKPLKVEDSAARQKLTPRQAVLPYRFASFVVGPSNALAREACLAISRGQQPTLSPLYLIGSTGLGKTHLARAVVEEVRSRGSKSSRYVSAEGFTTDLLSAIRSRQTGQFKRRYRQECDLLVLEDVQFLSKKHSTQLELFHTIQHLNSVGAPVVLTGDRLPRDIEELDERLSSQMASGLVAEISPPEPELRRSILRERAASGGVRLPEDCLQLLVSTLSGSIRDLEGVLIQIVASASLLKRPIDLELTEAALRKVVSVKPTGAKLDIREVVDVVSSFFGVNHSDLCSRSRKKAVLVPRQLAMYFCLKLTDASISEVGQIFRRDHPSVRNAVRRIERAILERAPLRYKVEELSSRLGVSGPSRDRTSES